MKLTNTLIASAVLLATSSVAFAATDTTSITINVTKDAYVNFIGTVDTATTKTLTLAEADNATTTIGDLGLESNTTGTCDVVFTSSNDFKLKHDTNAALFLHGASQYTVNWDGDAVSSGSQTVSLPSCNKVVGDFDVIMPSLPVGVVTAGTYSDTLTMVVTTQ